jgi:hypothetical protein
MKTFKVTADGVTKELEEFSENQTAFDFYCELPFSLSLREDLEIDGVKYGFARIAEEKRENEMLNKN